MMHARGMVGEVVIDGRQARVRMCARQIGFVWQELIVHGCLSTTGACIQLTAGLAMAASRVSDDSPEVLEADSSVNDSTVSVAFASAKPVQCTGDTVGISKGGHAPICGGRARWVWSGVACSALGMTQHLSSASA
jgi:hypothetical protein